VRHLPLADNLAFNESDVRCRSAKTDCAQPEKEESKFAQSRRKRNILGFPLWYREFVHCRVTAYD